MYFLYFLLYFLVMTGDISHILYLTSFICQLLQLALLVHILLDAFFSVLFTFCFFLLTDYWILFLWIYSPALILFSHQRGTASWRNCPHLCWPPSLTTSLFRFLLFLVCVEYNHEQTPHLPLIKYVLGFLWWSGYYINWFLSFFSSCMNWIMMKSAKSFLMTFSVSCRNEVSNFHLSTKHVSSLTKLLVQNSSFFPLQASQRYVKSMKLA